MPVPEATTPQRMPLFRQMMFHLACILALAWPAFVNGQPFFFPDTTAYVRSADVAAYIYSGKRISTAWTEHYLSQMAPKPAAQGAPPPASARPATAARGNDLGYGRIMAGRSPYFGAALWFSYVTSLFWLFVMIQAVVAYAMIRLCLRMFDLQSMRNVALTVALLSLVTTLPYYVGLLMPDLLAAFGMLGFMLLAIDRGRLRRGERIFLGIMLVASTISHLTHIWIIAVMAVTLGLIVILRRARWADTRGAFIAGAIAVAVGMGSVAITNAMVERQFGRAPQLVPLLTARFLADGPGTDYLKTHCPQAGFAICAYRDRPPLSAPAFLWATAPGQGIYLLASPAERAAMATQDKAFALAVLRAYPLQQGWMILRNSGEQLLSFDSTLLNYECGKAEPCGFALPPVDRARLLHSLGGRALWPQRLIGIVHYSAVGLALIVLLVWATKGRRGRFSGAERDILIWIAMAAAGMTINAVLGGAISEPQTRYQARIIWLLPFLALLAGLLWRRRASSTGNR